MRRGSLRKLALTLALLMLLTMSLPASARPHDEERPVPPGLADRDNDHISDGLAAAIGKRGPQEKINVVVTWTQAPDLGAARNAAGPFDIYAEFDVINGFAASLTAGQINALSKVPGLFRVEEDFAVSDRQRRGQHRFRHHSGPQRLRRRRRRRRVLRGRHRGRRRLMSSSMPGRWLPGTTSSTASPPHTTIRATAPMSPPLSGGDGVGGPNASLYRGVAPGVGIAAAKVLNSAGTGTESQIIARHRLVHQLSRSTGSR